MPVSARHPSLPTTARVPNPGGAGRPFRGALRAPGWPRALLGTLIGGGLGFGLVVALRAIAGLEIFQTEATGYPHLIVPALTAPLGFIAGIGCFDYWLRWAIGSATAPEDHSDHGAESWRDYLRFNTDHKVIGVQYIVTTFVFFFIGGLLAMLIRAELAQPGTQLVDPHTYNGLFSTHAAIMIFLFVIPVFAGIANYVLPLMLGAPDMAFPRLNALSFWLLPMAGILFIASFLVPGGAFDAGWTGYAPLSTGAPLGQSFFNLGVQFAGFSSIFAALNFLVTIITMRAPGMTFFRMPLLGLGQPGHLDPDRRSDTVHCRRAADGPLRPGAEHKLLPAQRRRRRPLLPAHLLVLLAPGGLHHDAAGLRDRLRGDLHPRAQAGLRLPLDGPLVDRDRHALLFGLGPPHVRQRHVQLAAGADDADLDLDRGPDRDQDLLLGGHPVSGKDPPKSTGCSLPSDSCAASSSAGSQA